MEAATQALRANFRQLAPPQGVFYGPELPSTTSNISWHRVPESPGRRALGTGQFERVFVSFALWKGSNPMAGRQDCWPFFLGVKARRQYLHVFVTYYFLYNPL
jgi:hypothetical protein